MSERLRIGNVPPEASDEALVAAVKKYCRRDGKVVQRVDADGVRPGRVLEEFADLELGELDEIAHRRPVLAGADADRPSPAPP